MEAEEQGCPARNSHVFALWFLKGKVFPKLKKRSPQGSSESASDKEDEEATDYVFRILYPGTQSEFGK